MKYWIILISSVIVGHLYAAQSVQGPENVTLEFIQTLEKITMQANTVRTFLAQDTPSAPIEQSFLQELETIRFHINQIARHEDMFSPLYSHTEYGDTVQRALQELTDMSRRAQELEDWVLRPLVDRQDYVNALTVLHALRRFIPKPDPFTQL